jgi:Fe-S-cluster containining protein
MNLGKKLYFLDGIYRIYDEFIQLQPLACKRRCADCCTCNMTLTTLEGYRVLSALDSNQKKSIETVVRQAADRQRFRPRLTTNQIAGLCMADQDVPDEAMAPDAGQCPLLTRLECPIYDHRPFGCRCMVSKVRCDSTGYANMDEIVLTVNNLFLQYIEHIDVPGLSGNFIDVLTFLCDEDNRRHYRSGELTEDHRHLISNAPIPAVMIPPRHRQKIQPILLSLQALFG